MAADIIEKIREAGGTTSGSEEASESKMSWQESEKEGVSETGLQESEKERESKMKCQEEEKRGEFRTRWQASKKEGVSKTSLQESEKERESNTTLQESESEKECESKMRLQESEEEDVSKTSLQEQEEESKGIRESKKTDQIVCDSKKADKAICDSASISDEETSLLTASPKSVNAIQTTTTTISVTGGDAAVMKELQRATATDVTARIDVMAELQDSPETPTEKKVSQNEYVEKLVCDLVDEFVSQSITTVCEVVANRKQTMAQSKGALPKPKRKSLSLGNQSVAGKVSPPATARSAWEKPPESGFNTQQQYFVDEMVASLVDDAVGNIVDIHNRKLSTASPSASPGKKGKVSIDLGKVATRRGSHFEQSSSFEEDLFVWTLSPESESSDDLGTADVEDADKMENVSRPHSPLPSHMKKTPDSADTDDFFGDFDLTPYKPPPPYPGSKENDAIAKPELLKITKEYYAVPHKREEIQQLVSDAVEILWQDKQKSTQLQDIALPETFLSVTENLSTEFDEHSCRSYKTMLFDLTREIVSEIYADKHDQSNRLHKSEHEDQSEGVFAQLLLQNSQLNINRYYRMHSKPPACLDELKRVVEKAIGSLLHLDGEAVPCGSSSRGHEFDKWKTSKKDHVDRILVQELQDEEPQWVNYDSDELQLKLQLTNSIMDSLIGNTVDTFKHIYNKHSQWQQVQL
ncbi:centrosome-associated protein 350-like [Octopus sinensis]|uniref:Centrosome-associated protein 350-like n=1 Tax=Octopus sinensis TaxID=2607531 RepID=A0A7E6FKU3_9MOLL|nr:centrosome-associated protein 350-like [Octopus sinensis]